jgi:glutathionylspermidine synthase
LPAGLAANEPLSIIHCAPLPNFSNQYPVLGNWLIEHMPCGLSIREDENPITGNTSRLLPHAIL